ncbi:hypothetical protein CL654_02995 [bacterium]|nr:hypothetical protein [bacterium]|tara:strand:+ start:3368 stop:3904 length:537 start_codon:yes stop_codon:yes gene_type:complete
MKLYRFSPIKSKEGLLEAIKHIHFECHKLCHQSFGKYLPNAGNMGVFCHYEDEYNFLTKLREEMTEPSDNPKQKYYKLHEPITIPEKDGVPETTYTHLYIRKPDPYRHHVGDVDFYLEPDEYTKLKQSLLDGTKRLKGARVFDRTDLDMIELYDPDVDVLGYVSTVKMTETVRVKQTQ